MMGPDGHQDLWEEFSQEVSDKIKMYFAMKIDM